jgi:hypothetical protein
VTPHNSGCDTEGWRLAGYLVIDIEGMAAALAG